MNDAPESSQNEQVEVPEPVKTPEMNPPTSKVLPLGAWLSKKSTVEVNVWLYRRPEEETITAIMSAPLTKEQMDTSGLVEMPLKAVFSVPDRRKMARYRERAGRWVAEAGVILTDKYRMRAQLLRNHLLSLDVIDPDTGRPLVIERGKDEQMTEESEKKIEDLHPTLLEMLMNKYEQVADLLIV